MSSSVKARHSVDAVRALLREWVFDKKVPKNVGFGRALGTALLILLLVQGVTGMFLATAYAPTPDHAYNSINYIDSNEVIGGALLRGVHHYGSSAIVVLMVLHMIRVFFTASYKHPRRGLWVVGMMIFGIIIGFSFTGYLLPWDQKAYWATSVGLNIAESVPYGGEVVADLLRGGKDIGALTLTRMYALHILFLPLLLIGTVWLHLFLVHRVGITPPGLPVGEPEEHTEPFFPHHVFRELVVGCLALAIVFALSWYLKAPLEAPANPDSGGYDPRPDWYFLGLFQMLKYFEGDRMIIGTVVIPGGITLLLFLWPFLDRGKQRLPSRRPISMTFGVALVASVVTLTVLGAMDPGTESKRVERVRLAPVEMQTPDSPPITTLVGDGAKIDPEMIDFLYDLECLQCHLLYEEGADLGGPPLEQIARERDAEWIHKIILDPKSEYPDTDMPSAEELEMTDEERNQIVDFIVGLNQ